MSVLLASDVAAEYARTEGWRKHGSGADLVRDVDRYMASRGLAGSAISRIAIAQEYLRLREQPEPERAPLPSPEQAAWQQNQADGIGDQRIDEVMLANRVAAMGAREFAASRKQLGVERTLADFLTGQ